MEDEQRNDQYPDPEKVITVPVPRYYALVAGMGLVALGVLGMIPALSEGGTLLRVLHVSAPLNAVHLLTGLLGLLVFATGKRGYATTYALLLGLVYLVVFTIGNLGFGNLDATLTGSQKFPYIVSNGLQATIMVVSWLIAGLSALQAGDRATRRYRGEHSYSIFTRTRLPGS